MRVRRNYKVLLFSLFLLSCVGFYSGLMMHRDDSTLSRHPMKEIIDESVVKKSILLQRLKGGDEDDGHHNQFVKKFVQLPRQKSNTRKMNKDEPTISSMKESPNFSKTKSQIQLNYNVHLFYYPWYKNEQVDGHYAHWNHKLLPHWNSRERRKWPDGQHVPPKDIGSNFYPELGPYSSADSNVLEKHMEQIQSTGAGVIAVSWYPPHLCPSSEVDVTDTIPAIFEAANKYGIKVTFHIEPFLNRTAINLNWVIKHLIIRYGRHPAFYRTERAGKMLPLFYFYDSYQVPPSEWSQVLKPKSKLTVRDTQYDCIAIGLLVDFKHLSFIQESKFDGFYTYFASNKFTYGSTWKNWKPLSLKAKTMNLIFIPSVGPGYIDTRVRPWNGANTKSRENGEYYRQAFWYAGQVHPDYLSITSFNEWHEGTQIETAVPMSYKGFHYLDYTPHSPSYYLERTRQYIQSYISNSSRI